MYLLKELQARVALQERLRVLGACADGVRWIVLYSDPLVAWHDCTRGDWLLWLAIKLDVQRELIVRAACACARLALPCTSDPQPLQAIQLAEQWAGGLPRPSVEQVMDAARAKDTPWTSRASNQAAAAARYAAEGVYPSDYAAFYAAAFAAIAIKDSIADANDREVACEETLRKCAALVREHIDGDIMLRLWNERFR
jgi:hypothetical protein